MTKLMLVEDDNNLREIYGARLQAEGYEIVSAKDGEEALALAVKERPDLIISDVMMPKISGFDMLDILRSTPETKDTKVIMMTALSQKEDQERGEKLGADRYLVKSQVTLEDVVRVVDEVVKGDSAAVNAVVEQATQAPTIPAPTTALPAPLPTPAVAPVPVAPAPVTPVVAPTPAAPQPVVQAAAPAAQVAALPVAPIAQPATPPAAPAPIPPQPVQAPVATPMDNNVQQSQPIPPAQIPSPAPVEPQESAPTNPIHANPPSKPEEAAHRSKVIQPITDMQKPDINELMARESPDLAVAQPVEAATPTVNKADPQPTAEEEAIIARKVAADKDQVDLAAPSLQSEQEALQSQIDALSKQQADDSPEIEKSNAAPTINPPQPQAVQPNPPVPAGPVAGLVTDQPATPASPGAVLNPNDISL